MNIFLLTIRLRWIDVTPQGGKLGSRGVVLRPVEALRDDDRIAFVRKAYAVAQAAGSDVLEVVGVWTHPPHVVLERPTGLLEDALGSMTASEKMGAALGVARAALVGVEANLDFLPLTIDRVGGGGEGRRGCGD
jgi:hypothetical protein